MIAYENCDLAFDTTVMSECAKEYENIAEDLKALADKLQTSLNQMTGSGWTTKGGKAFEKMVDADWNTNIQKYTDLLETLKSILEEAVREYEDLVSQQLEKVKIEV